MSNRRMARECALQALYYADSIKASDENALLRYAQEFKGELSECYPFCEGLVKGTVEHLAEIDKLVSTYAKNWTISRMSAGDRPMWRVATYELVFSPDHTPVPAVIDEAIELAKKYSTENSSKFINGLLDQLKKERN